MGLYSRENYLSLTGKGLESRGDGIQITAEFYEFGVSLISLIRLNPLVSLTFIIIILRLFIQGYS